MYALKVIRIYSILELRNLVLYVLGITIKSKEIEKTCCESIMCTQERVSGKPIELFHKLCHHCSLVHSTFPPSSTSIFSKDKKRICNLQGSTLD